MKSNEAKAVVRSLVGRLIHQDGAYRLPEGILSEEDVAALQSLAGIEATSADTKSSKAKQPSIPIDRSAFDTKGPSEEEIRLCLDFGTAMSKAWATRRTEDETVPLVLGRVAGTGDTLAVPSSIFISQTGRIYFGVDAEIQHRQEIDSGRRRFDNLKRMLSEAEVGQELDDVTLSSDIDPTASGLSKGDLLVLYLAWLTDLALKALKNDLGDRQSADGDGAELRYLCRRFAIPCFEHAQDETVGGAKRAEWAKRIMERALLRAQVVADTLTDKWVELSVDGARLLLSEVRGIDTAKLTHLLAETAPVREPIAAGASRFDEKIAEAGTATSAGASHVRRALLVIDAGAGTTDFALFQVFWDSDREKIRYALIAPAVRMCRVAGNAVDEVLRPIILTACGVDPKSGHPRSDEDFGIIKLDLSARIRDIKQDLFTNDLAEIELRPNASGLLRLDAILKNSEYERLGKELRLARDILIESAFGKDPAFLEELGAKTRRLGRSLPIHVLLTGGSSVLPIVQKLAEGELTIGGVPFGFLQVTERPSWIESLPREEADLVAAAYPQCAVAIGGSARELPEELPDLSSLVMPPRSGKRVLERYQVTGVG